MWCKNCNIETNEKKCPICCEETVEDYPTEVYWCNDCKVPIMQEVNQADKGICPRCGKLMKYLATDIRPVFPEERLLIEILLKKKPYQWMNESVWASNNRYYVNGKSIALPNKLFKEANADEYIELLDRYKDGNSYTGFNHYIDLFIEANKTRLDYLIDESHNFIKKTAAKFPEENIVLSFSGGAGRDGISSRPQAAVRNVRNRPKVRENNPKVLFLMCLVYCNFAADFRLVPKDTAFRLHGQAVTSEKERE